MENVKWEPATKENEFVNEIWELCDDGEGRPKDTYTFSFEALDNLFRNIFRWLNEDMQTNGASQEKPDSSTSADQIKDFFKNLYSTYSHQWTQSDQNNFLDKIQTVLHYQSQIEQLENNLFHAEANNQQALNNLSQCESLLKEKEYEIKELKKLVSGAYQQGKNDEKFHINGLQKFKKENNL